MTAGAQALMFGMREERRYPGATVTRLWAWACRETMSNGYA